VNDLIRLLIWAAVIGVIFGVLWRKGYLARLSNYVMETREELRKCTWPSFPELKGSTIVVLVSVAILGSYIVGVDFIISVLIRFIT
jgi:preprotein translocase subunit SecE